MKEFELKQGEVFDEPVEFDYPGFDFTGCVITSQLRTKAEGPVVHEFTIAPPDFSTEGKAYFRLTMSKSQTTALETRTYKGDIKVERSSPAYGPYIVAPFTIKVEKPITQTA